MRNECSVHGVMSNPAQELAVQWNGMGTFEKRGERFKKFGWRLGVVTQRVSKGRSDGFVVEGSGYMCNPRW